MRVLCKGYKKSEKYFTLGRVYEIKKNGEITADNGYTYHGLHDEDEALKFLSSYYNFEVVNDISVNKVIFNNPATIVFWSDGTKTVAKCHVNDEWDAEKGLAMAISKKMLGKDFRGVFDTYLPKHWLVELFKEIFG